MEFVDTNEGVDHTSVELVDRAGDQPFPLPGGNEQMVGGQPILKRAGKRELRLPFWKAVFFLKKNSARVWTTEQEFTHRFGLGNNDEDVQARLIAVLGHEFEDITPITIDTNAIEGWDTRGAERSGPGTQVRLTGAALREAKMAQRERLGGAARPAFAP